MKFVQRIGLFAIAINFLAVPGAVYAQTASFERLPQSVLDIAPPSSRVTGIPGNMRFENRECRSLPTQNIRPRIVDSVVQEWAYFGFSVQDQTVTTSSNSRRRWPRISSEQALRVADSIGGYWATTPDSTWILERQNSSWEASGVGSRWRNPWSAAFISWVMCESGLGEPARFERAIAHHSYIDQAILAREAQNSESAFVAYEPGEQAIVPGDMLCRGSRPAYKSIAERRRHLGVGARTHCDIVVKVDEVQSRIMVIGGNVRGTVGMKLLPASVDEQGTLKPAPYRGRMIFAHLKLNAEPISFDALDHSATFRAMNCSGAPTPAALVSARLNDGLQSNCETSASD